MNKLILSFGIALWAICSHAQVVNIPDVNFKAALIATGVDANNDKQIQTSEAQAITKMDISYKFSGSQIEDLTGIHAFTNMTFLGCAGNLLTTLDVSENMSLTKLDCSNNQLSNLNLNVTLDTLMCNNNQLLSLDVGNSNTLTSLYCQQNQLNTLNISGAKALVNLSCISNQLTVLDISKNTNLVNLYCYNNKLLELNLTTNSVLALLWCFSNQLTVLDVSKNTNLTSLRCNANLNLTQICINNSQISHESSWQKDASANWSTTCTTGIEEQELLHTNKKLIRILTPLGQELQPEQATEGLYIYQYSDGSTRKVMKQ